MGCHEEKYNFFQYQYRCEGTKRIFSNDPIRYQFDLPKKNNFIEITKEFNINQEIIEKSENGKLYSPNNNKNNNTINLIFETDSPNNDIQSHININNDYSNYISNLNDIHNNNIYNEYNYNIQQEELENFPNTTRVRKIYPYPGSIRVENDYDINEEIDKQLSEMYPEINFQTNQYPYPVNVQNSVGGIGSAKNNTNHDNNYKISVTKVTKMNNDNYPKNNFTYIPEENIDFKGKKTNPFYRASRNPSTQNKNRQNQIQNNNIDITKTIPPDVVNFFYQLEFKELEDFDPELWRKMCPEEADFFNYNKGNVISNKMSSENELNETETYIGEINEYGERNGFGKLISPSKKRIGTWRKNNFTGWGREVRQNGEIYEGKFIEGELTGKGIYKNGDITYIGNFYKFLKHGKGDLFTKQYHYNGNFNNDQMEEGKGTFEYYDKSV